MLLLSITDFFFFFFKQKTAYEIGVRLVGSEMCIRDSAPPGPDPVRVRARFFASSGDPAAHVEREVPHAAAGRGDADPDVAELALEDHLPMLLAVHPQEHDRRRRGHE